MILAWASPFNMTGEEINTVDIGQFHQLWNFKLKNKFHKITIYYCIRQINEQI